MATNIISREDVSFCVPLTSTNIDELQKSINDILKTDIRLIEYRRDYLEDPKEEDEIFKLLKDLRDREGIEVIYTNRSFKEGGEKNISTESRRASLKNALEKDAFDYIDIEEISYDDFKDILSDLSPTKKIIKSYHNFDSTPESEEILDHLLKNNIESDIVKAAFMIHDPDELGKLWVAALKFREKENEKPLILIGMGEDGTFSRVYPELVSSNLSFSPIGKNSSAPGQLNYELIKLLRESINEEKKTYIFDWTHGEWEDDYS